MGVFIQNDWKAKATKDQTAENVSAGYDRKVTEHHSWLSYSAMTGSRALKVDHVATEEGRLEKHHSVDLVSRFL